jgi:mRNA interferase MazF
MQTFSRNDVVLIRYPFSDLSQFKVRPAVIVGPDRESPDLFIVPLTSRLSPTLPGEFPLTDWRTAGLHVPSAVKRGIYTVDGGLVIKRLGRLSRDDEGKLKEALRSWLAL